MSARPEGNENPDLPTGEIEVVADDVEVLSEAAPLPFPIDDAPVEVGEEETRLRTATSTCAAAARPDRCACAAKVNRLARDVLRRATTSSRSRRPTLTRSTPEGARDFLVPVRLQPGQLVRAAAVAAAVQAAADGRRHGALLPDRALLPRRGLPRRPAAGVHPARHRDVLRRPGRRHRAGEEVARGDLGPGGSRDPAPDPADDLRRRDGAATAPTSPTCGSAWSSSTCTAYFADTTFRVFQAEHVGAVVMPGGASQPRRQFDAWQEWAKQRGAKGLAYVTSSPRTASSAARSPRTSPRPSGPACAAHTGAQPGDCVFFARRHRRRPLGRCSAPRAWRSASAAA